MVMSFNVIWKNFEVPSRLFHNVSLADIPKVDQYAGETHLCDQKISTVHL